MLRDTARGSGSAAVVAAVLVGLLRLLPVPAAAQTGGAPAGKAASRPAAQPKAGPAPKTPWGEPDLQGIWTRDSDTPLQRPAKYANREFFTDEELAALDKQIAGILGRATTEGRRKRGSEKDVTGAYNAEIFTTHLRTGRRTSLIVDPPDGKIPAPAEEALKRRASLRAFQLALLQQTEMCRNKERGCAGGKYDPNPSPLRDATPPVYLSGGAAGVINRVNGPEDRALGERCMSGSVPDFSGFRRIVQTQNGITMFYDTGQGQGWQRNIVMNGTPHLPSNIRQWWGDSRGRWEGNTLVIDVTNFSPKSNFQGANENLHLVERWTRVDADTIDYSVTIEDPTVWTKPWTVRQELKKQPDEPNRIYYEPRCHEGNYGMLAMLQGARTEERAFAEGRGPDPATKCKVDADCGGFAGGFAEEGDDANPLR